MYPEVTFANGPPTSLTTFVAGTWPATENRIGLLSDPSYFWAQSDPAANSIVKRGKAIHDDVICADPLPPPVDLSSPAALAVIARGDSEITKSDARLATAPCNGCAVQKMSSYLLGSMIQTYDTCEVDALRKTFDQSDGTLASLFRTVVIANFVRARAGGTK
ncbi:MAG TPA: DUF1588 domain-containing protein [Polyangiaceae bacterium]|nr:DUF1588 domain-containing protein [Polyangiaceae bacterium]